MKLISAYLLVFILISCNNDKVSPSIEPTGNKTDTIVNKTYGDQEEQHLARIEKVWKIDTIFIQDTISSEIYPMEFRHGEIQLFDSLGEIISKNKIELKLKPHYIVLGKTSLTSDSLVPFRTH